MVVLDENYEEFEWILPTLNIHFARGPLIRSDHPAATADRHHDGSIHPPMPLA
jgi:hypothetical protein